MRRFLAKALATLLVAFSASALAMGLGDIHLNSYLNQRLDAEIELVSAAADETESLQVSLADRAAFERIGLDRPAVLSSLEFEVVRRSNGTAYIKVTSSEPIREPFLTFLIEADWSRGRLLREYTLLLDPPTFAEERQAAPAEARSPVSTPAPVTPEPVPEPVAEEPAAEEPVAEEPAAADEPQVAEEQKPVAEEQKPAAEEEAVTEQPAEEQVSIPPLEADREPAQEPVYRSAPDMGDSYGPIQRNETLWSIASRLRPDDSITMNQMMVAIYRANPEAFDDNMNRMKQGYILRIPDFTEVSSLGRAEAFRDAKRMNDDWNAARGRLVAEDDFRVEEPEADDSLSLVAPEEDVEPEVGTGVGAGGEAGDVGTPGEAAVEVGEDDIDEGAVDLVEEDEAETSDRLVDVEDESMQALQAGTGEEAAAEEPVEEPVQEEPVEEETALPPVETMDEADEPAVEEEATTETGMPEEEPVEEEPVLDEADEEPVTGTETDEAAAEEAATTEPEAQPDRAVTTRTPEPTLVDKAMSFLLSPVGLGAVGGLLLLILALLFMMQKRRKEAREQAASEMADWLADEEAQEAETTLAAGDETGDEATGADEETAAFSATDDVGEESDDEPGFAESTQMISPEDRPETGAEPASDEESGGKSVTLDENDPLSEADFNMAYGLYDQAAEVVQKAADRAPDRADLKAKLCEIHFAANNKDGFMEAARGLKEIAGTDGSDWSNVAIMGRQIAPDESLFEEGGAGGGAVDLDFGESEAEVSSDDSEMDFEKTLIGSESEPPKEPAPADSGDDLDFDLDIGEPADESESPAEEPAPETEASGDTGGDLDFDLDLDTGGGDETPASEAPAEEEKEESSDLDVGDLDLGDFESEASEAPAEPAAEPEKPAAGEDEFDTDTTQTEFDKALGELSAYVDTNLPEGDAGDEVSQEGGGEDLNLDEFSFDKDSESGSGEEDYDTGGEEDEEGLGEVGTKLDLARAYIDMGDPDGARSILEEVVEDGDEEQKKEAQDLLGKL